ncbi:double-stranded RNA-binding protein 1-like [Lycium ferocissimum]|uniref:double-stranded RNA-binding protein 1-like n=1 Tax=Lycium ferocissimum TaxID=112874 RepID=UPI002814FFC0|nr:double-stranded RNA-binding protein 1-like [Lycium ferocissimum]
MYKSKLQEVCQNKKWALPKYCCMKDGEDHDPKFKASVVVNGINFDSPTLCKSSKEAHNEAAKFAFLHFTSVSGSIPTTEAIGLTKVEGECLSLQDKSTSEVKQGGSLPTVEGSGITKTEEPCQFPFEIKQEDSHYQYKTKLQIYAKRKNLGVPVYQSKRKSSSRDLYFEATVILAGELFKSPGAYKSAGEAEDSVAQLALMTLLTVSFEKSNASIYKSFLQELAQHEEICLPEYRTTGVGEPHNLTFLSSVEIEGEIFRGDGAKSKKQAEENAAKVAYTALTKCKSFFAGNPSTVSSDFEGEIVKTEPIMDSLSISIDQEKFRGLSHIIRLLLMSYYYWNEKDMVNASSISLGMQELSVNEKSSSSVESSRNFRSKTISSAAMTPCKSSTLSNANSSARTTAETKSYLLSNRVRVYKYIPDEVFPRGTIVLPIAEDKWAVVSLEFPNEKCG